MFGFSFGRGRPGRAALVHPLCCFIAIASESRPSPLFLMSLSQSSPSLVLSSLTTEDSGQRLRPERKTRAPSTPFPIPKTLVVLLISTDGISLLRFRSTTTLGLIFLLLDSLRVGVRVDSAPNSDTEFSIRKKTVVVVTYCKEGRGLIKINGNGCPIELVGPEILRFKVYEPILRFGRHHFASVDMRIRIKGGGHTSHSYAIRQSIAKALVAYYQKFVDEQSTKEIKDILVRYDRTLLVADPRYCEPKKFGGGVESLSANEIL